MSVLSVEQLWEDRDGSDGIERKRNYRQAWEVITDDPADDATVAGGPEAAALGLPRNADPHPGDEDAVVVSIDATNTSETPLRWLVVIQYSTELPRDLGRESQTIDPATGDSTATATAPGAGGSPAGQRDGNPVNWSAVYKVSHEQTTEPLTHDKNGDPIVNSAGDPFHPPLEIERSYAVVTVTKNYSSVKFDWLETYVDTVNLDVWNGRPARTCRMIALEYESVTENNVSFWRATFRIKIKPGSWAVRDNDTGQGWDVRVLDQGFRTRTATDPGPPPVYRYTNITDPKTGEKPEKPVLLDGDGHLHPTVTDDTIQSEPRYVTWEAYDTRSWTALGI